MKEKMKVILDEFESQINRDNTIVEMQESINIYTDKISTLLNECWVYDDNDCDATEIDIY